MATKTISVDLDAYRRLKSARRGKESFSMVIKRMIHRPLDVDKYLDSLDAAPMSGGAVKAVEAHETARHVPSGRAR